MDVENFRVQSEDEIKTSSIDILRSVPGDLVNHLIDKEWALLRSPKGESFYISDHPVTMHNNYPRSGRGNHGLGLYGIEIHFPITPRLCLTFVCSEMIGEFRNRIYDHYNRKLLGNAFPIDISEIEMLIRDIDQRQTRDLKPENIEFHNSLQVIQSSRFVYSKNKSFSLAKDMLKTNPEIAKNVELLCNEYN